MGKRFYIIGGVGVVGVIALAWWLLPSLSWDGGAVIEFNFAVIDAKTGQPISDADLAIVREENLATYENAPPGRLNGRCRTNPQGHATARAEFSAGGTSHFLWRGGSVIYLGQWLIVQADGFQSRMIPVCDITGPRGSLGNRKFAATIGLRKTPVGHQSKILPSATPNH